MPVNYATLKSELTTDASGLGYSGLLAVGNAQAVADRMNTNLSGLSGLVTQLIFRDDIGLSEVVANIASGDFINLAQIQISKLQLLFAGSAQTIDVTNINYRVNLGSIFSGMNSTKANFSGMFTRIGSRSEVLFGDGITVAPADVSLSIAH